MTPVFTAEHSSVIAQEQKVQKKTIIKKGLIYLLTDQNLITPFCSIKTS